MIKKMKNRSHKYDMNRHRRRHGRNNKYTEYKKGLSMVVFICVI